MKSKYRKSLSIIMILVILVSHSIIPVSASSDYYESTYNNYDYYCFSEFTTGSTYGEMGNDGPNRICVEIYLVFRNNLDMNYYYAQVTSTAVLSYGYCGIDSGPYETFIFSDYTYTIMPNQVYFIELDS